MICVEEVESECGLWSVERRRVPTYPQKLTVLFNPTGRFFARAELYVHIVGASDIYNEDPIEGVGGRARCLLVADVEIETQLSKARWLVKTLLPNLRKG